MKKNAKKLTLAKTTLKVLTGRELVAAVGGGAPLPGSNNTCKGALCKLN